MLYISYTNRSCMSVEVRITQGDGRVEVCSQKLSILSEVIQHLITQHEGTAEREIAKDGNFVLTFRRPLIGDVERYLYFSHPNTVTGAPKLICPFSKICHSVAVVHCVFAVILMGC